MMTWFDEHFVDGCGRLGAGGMKYAPITGLCLMQHQACSLRKLSLHHGAIRSMAVVFQRFCCLNIDMITQHSRERG